MEHWQVRLRKEPLSKEAHQRLLRDWTEVQNEPIPTVKARPLDNDISEWHCTLLPNEGPYQGIPFHLILTFPSDYPNRPPQVRVCTSLTHPNVFSGSICLDMFKEPDYYAEPYRGWSTAYSVQSVLLQLQSFLFAENVPQGCGESSYSIKNPAGTSAADAARRDAAAFVCHACGFEGSGIVAAESAERERAWERAQRALEAQRANPSNNPFNLLGVLEDVSESDIAAARSPARSRQRRAQNLAVSASPNPEAGQGTAPAAADRLSELPADVLVQVMDRLDGAALSALVRAGKYYARAATERGAWVRRELQCFHSKRGFGEEVLGFGMEVKGLESGKRWEGVLLMDYLSAGAFFEEKVRKGVWNERLTWWLPLVLDDQHCARALPLLKATIAALATDPRRAVVTRGDILDLAPKFLPLDTLKVLPRLMNGMVVSFMKQEEAKQQVAPYSFVKQEGAGQQVNLHASEKALLGYCQLHHMLLRLAQEYPVIQETIDGALSNFQDNPSARQKNATPDLGELLVLLSAAQTGGVTWASLAPAFMGESFDRNVLWLLKSHPELAVLENDDTVSEYRMVTTFMGTTVSRRLIMFQVAFLLLVRPADSSVRDVLAEYAQRYGYPRPGLTRKLQTTWYDVLKVATWVDFYGQLGLACPPTPLALCSTLRQAVVSSSRKRYHSISRLWPGPREGLMQLRWRYEPTMRTQYQTCLV